MLETSFSRVLGPFFVALPKSYVKLRWELSGTILHISTGKDIKRFRHNQCVAFTVFIPLEVLQCHDREKNNVTEVEYITVLRADLRTN